MIMRFKITEKWQLFRNRAHFIFTVLNEVAGRWFFHSCLSVEVSPCDHYPSCIGPHCTPHPPSPQPWPPRHQTWDTLLKTSGGHHWRPIQTCSFEDPPLVLTSGGRSLHSWQVGGTHPTWILLFVLLLF